MPVTLESLDAKLDRILALVTPVPGPDQVNPPKLWKIVTTRDADRLDPEFTPVGRFGVWSDAVLAVRCKAGPLDSCVWFDAAGEVIGTNDLPVSALTLDERQSQLIHVKAACAKATAEPRLTVSLLVYVAPRRIASEPSRAVQAASPRDWSIRHDWPAEWPAVADDGRMPQLPEARDVETLVEYARHGYERDGTPMRGPVSLGFAGNEIEALLELTDEAYARSRYGKAGIVRDLACYGLLTKRIKVDYDLSPGDSLASQTWTGVAYPSLEALLARETDMFGGGQAGPGGRP